MSITYQCEQCNQWYSVRENKVGTKARCRDCGHEMVVPNTPDLFDDALDGPSGGAAPPIGRRPMAPTTSASRPAPASPSVGGDAASGKLWGGGLGVAGFILILILKMTLRGPAFGGRPRPAWRPPPAPVATAPVDLDGPIRLPARFPDLGTPKEIEPGVYFQEIVLPVVHPTPPGHSGRLWLYLPAAPGGGRPAAGSLPCVLIAPAGSGGLTGMKLAPGDHPEHLPYARGGFAVLAFELDGPDPQPIRRNLSSIPSMQAFLRARAGLVNGEISRAFLKEEVPEVDLGRLYVAGHRSAGMFAWLLAPSPRSGAVGAGHTCAWSTTPADRDRRAGGSAPKIGLGPCSPSATRPALGESEAGLSRSISSTPATTRTCRPRRPRPSPAVSARWARPSPSTSSTATTTTSR